MSDIIPADATPVANPPFTYYLWPEVINAGITPIVRIHISTWENPDAECDCLDRELDDNVRAMVDQVLDACREQARQMLWEQSHWVIRGRPETVFTCSHDYDPRAETT